MNNNKLIINNFKKLVNYKINNKFDKNNKYKINIYENFINFVENIDYDIKSANDLLVYKNKNVGIGKGIIKRVNEILTNGYLKEIIDNNDDNNNIIKDIKKIYGFGDQLIKELIEKYKIKSIDDIIKLVKNGEIVLNKNTTIGLKYYKKIKTKITRNDIKLFYINVKKIIKSLFKNIKIKVCGSYRRKNKFSNDIDLLITQKNNKKRIELYDIIKELKKNNIIKEEFQNDYVKTKYSFISNNYYIVDIRFVDIEDYYTTLLHMTGSKLFNINLRKKAKLLGYKLNEYGLYKNDNKIKINSEKDIFEKLGLSYIKPNDR